MEQIFGRNRNSVHSELKKTFCSEFSTLLGTPLPASTGSPTEPTSEKSTGISGQRLTVLNDLSKSGILSAFCVKHQVSKSVTTLPGWDTSPGGSVAM